MTIRYISADQVAHLLSYASGRQITERIARLPGFPVPVRFPTASGGIGQPRWREDEIIAWAESLRAAAIAPAPAPAQNRQQIVNC